MEQPAAPGQPGEFAAGRETTPFLSEDNVTLFFSSNRGESSGGNDIFMCKRLDDTWTQLVQPDPAGRADQLDSRRQSAVFQYDFGVTCTFLPAGAATAIFTGCRLLRRSLRKSEVIGRVLNRKTGALMQNVSISYGAMEETGLPADMITSDNGAFRLQNPERYSLCR
ncbi:MAG: hypothetical protein V9F82_07755 [Dermatophilaceae bacterium]